MSEPTIVNLYEPRFTSVRHRTFYRDSGYSNFGYWDTDTRDGREACDRLLDRLLDTLPTPPATVLDVACGEGGTTARIHHRFPEAEITAVNISPSQLARAAARCPWATFLRMDATRLAFPDVHFDVVMCIEAAYHFHTREAFLREAHRVLVPGGRLLLTDGIFRRPPGMLARRLVPDLATMPTENFVDRAGYEQLLQDVGFTSVAIEDALDRTFIPCARHFMRHAWTEYMQPHRWPQVLREVAPPGVALWWRTTRRYLSEYLLVQAVKPEGTRA